MANDLVLGRGEIHFARFGAGTQVPLGERYLGNTPAFGVNITTEKLDHFNSDAGIKEKDDSIELQVDRMGTLECDNISAANIALFFFGDVSTVTVASPVVVTNEEFPLVEQGLAYQLGVSSTAPAGVRKVTSVTVQNDASSPTTFVLNTDYTLDAALGRITVVAGGGIDDGTNLVVDYTVSASTRERVISGNTPIEGALRYIATNPKGTIRDVFIPWVKLTPNGEFALKSDEWLKMSFNIEILKKTGYEAVYIDGRTA